MLINKLNISIDINVLAISIFIISVFYLIDRVYIDNEMNNCIKVNYSKLQKIANTGDIICFRWNCVDIGFRLFSKYSHVGMIVKLPNTNDLYILEIHPQEDIESNINNSGVHLYKLKKRLKYYDGDLYYSKLNVDNKYKLKMSKRIIKNLNKYKKEIPFDTNFRNAFVLNWFYDIFNWELPERNSMFCSEFIGAILQYNNIYKHHKNLQTLNPGTFLEFKQNNTNLYSEIYEVNLLK